MPEEAQYHDQELESFDLAMTDLVIALTGEPPDTAHWQSPRSFSYEHQPHGANWEPMGWLKTYKRGLEISKSYLQTFLPTYSNEVHMGDKITVGAAQVVVGSNAKVDGGITTHGSVNSAIDTKQNLIALADELATLRKALRQQGTLPEHDIALGSVAAAENAAREGNKTGAMDHLKGAGKWCLEVATKLGVEVAASAIKSSMGIGKDTP